MDVKVPNVKVNYVMGLGMGYKKNKGINGKNEEKKEEKKWEEDHADIIIHHQSKEHKSVPIKQEDSKEDKSIVVIPEHNKNSVSQSEKYDRFLDFYYESQGFFHHLKSIQESSPLIEKIELFRKQIEENSFSNRERNNFLRDFQINKESWDFSERKQNKQKKDCWLNDFLFRILHEHLSLNDCWELYDEELKYQYSNYKYVDDRFQKHSRHDFEKEDHDVDGRTIITTRTTTSTTTTNGVTTDDHHQNEIRMESTISRTASYESAFFIPEDDGELLIISKKIKTKQNRVVDLMIMII